MRAFVAAIVLLLAASPAAAEIRYVIGGGYNTTGPATSCADTDVALALTSVTASVTEIRLGSGTCNWTSRQIMSVPSGSGGLSLIGAGTLTVRGGADVTIIVDNIASTDDSVVTVDSGSVATTILVRVAGLTFRGGTGIPKNHGFIKFDGSTAPHKVRIDHNTFDKNGVNHGAAFKVFGAYGVGDSNIANLGFVNWGPTSDDGDLRWSQATDLGSANFFFLEDNAVTVTGAINDAYNGARFVIRFNTGNGAQTHPTGGSGRARGVRAWEVYANNWNVQGGPEDNGMYAQSGTGVFFLNTLVAGFENGIKLVTTRKSNTTYSQTATPNGWGYCGTDFNGVGSNWDQNTTAAKGYACIDQVGRGQGDLLANAFPNATNTATGCISSSACAYPRQALEPIYEWTNTHSLGSMYTDDTNGRVTANVDYYAYNTSNCVAGGACPTNVGSGTTLPTTCATGVGFFKTNEGTWNAGTNSFYTGQGVFYKCTAPNTFTVSYTPYLYPHPLTCGHTDGTACGSSPAPPTAVGRLGTRFPGP